MKCWIVAVLVATGCKSAPSTEQCEQLLGHIVDLEFKKAGAVPTGDAMKAEIASQKKAVTEARATEFTEKCTKNFARSRVECALSAADVDAVGRCDEAK